jgi:flagellar basal body-associated protein FliL
LIIILIVASACLILSIGVLIFWLMRRNNDNESDINTPTSSIKPDGDQNYRKSFVGRNLL